ncbi:MAG: PP2C family serine/threonine-protein phosphatase [Dyadobacter sp.]|uniref:PP2C family protein-serine/threonine phosphatase n=1 Tax=Dyadobacter sp. TaxID=1914288 RepID=UPI003265A0A4
MKVDIYQPTGFTEVGQRTNNEDSIFPPLNAVHKDARLFLVCDGVGGQHKGEVASLLACESLNTFFENNPVDVADDIYIKNALKFTTDQFNEKESEDKETSGMATTLTLVHFNEAGATIAHLGDSRIYQIRKGRVIRVSDDHKLVHELVKEGHITEQEAQNHSQRNVITKVISADRNDTPDVKIINDVIAGDYFFLCTDGVLELIYDDLLVYHLRETEDNNISDSEKLENIRLECAGKTRDNFSAYLIRIQAVSGSIPPAFRVILPPVEDAPVVPVAQPVRNPDFRNNYEHDSPTEFSRPVVPKINAAPDPPSIFRQTPPTPAPKSKKLKLLPYAIGIFIGIMATAAGMLYQRSKVSPTQAVQEVKVPETIKIESEQEKKGSETLTKQKPEAIKEQVESKTNAQSDVLAESKSYKFTLVKQKDEFYAIEPQKGGKTKIKYEQLLSIPNVLHYYSFPGSEKSYLYLSIPDKRIGNIDSVDIGTNETVYFINGQKNKIENTTGKKVNLSVKDMKEKLTDQASNELVPVSESQKKEK